MYVFIRVWFVFSFCKVLRADFAIFKVKEAQIKLYFLILARVYINKMLYYGVITD